MTTLVIHPYDPSTDFLIPIYEGIKDATVVTSGVTKEEVLQLIEEHDRVIMLGHGSASGLFSVGQFRSYGMIIDHVMVKALSKKTDNVYIWCNADRFVEEHSLKGFYTGMFISEYGEAQYCNVPTYKGEVEKSNELFAKLVGEHINESPLDLFKTLKKSYNVPNSGVAAYNNDRLYLAD